MNELFHTIIGLPIIISIILKITIVLCAGWIAHLLVAQYNPRWRVVIWRCVIIGIFLVPALVPVRYFKIKVAPEPEKPVITESYSVPQSFDIAESSDFVMPRREFSEFPIESTYAANPVSDNIVYTAKKSFSLQEWLNENKTIIAVSSWLFITMLLFVRLLIGFIRIKSVSRLSVSAPENLNQLLSKVAADLQCHRKVKLYLSEQLHTPFLAGFTKPVIILPKQMVSDKHIQEVPAILAHEITHLCSGDLFWMLAARIVGILLWFHPLVWKLRNVHDSACEEVCDAVAANYVGSAELYSSALARAALNVTRIVSAAGAIPMARSSNVIARLRTLKRKVYSSPIAKRWVVLSVSAIMIVFTCLGGLKLVYAEQNNSGDSIAVSNDEGNGIVSSENEFVYEGKLTFNKKLPVGLSAGTLEYPDLIEINSISIEGRYGNAWEVFVDFGWLPLIDSTWRITTELLDRDGKVLPHSRDEQTTFTLKASDANQEKRQYVELSTDSMHFQGRRHAARFRITLEPLPTRLADLAKKKLNVTALSQENQKPVEDAALIVKSTSRPIEIYKTNSKGQCEIEINSENLKSLNINVQKQGYTSMSKFWSNSSSSTGSSTVVDLPESHTFEMSPAIAIGGILQNEEGNAIEGAKLSYRFSMQRPEGNISIDHCSLTDSDGKWRIEGVPLDIDKVSIGFRHPDYKSDTSAGRRISDQKLKDAKGLKLVEVLSKDIEFTGVVLNEEGKPIPDATVLMSRYSSNPFYDITDSKGQFKIVNSSERSEYREDTPAIIVEAPGFVPEKREVDVTVKPESMEFRLTRGRNVKCHVVDSQGNPIENGWTVFDPIPDDRNYSVWLDDTDSNGDFVIPNVPDHDIKLTVGKQGFLTIRDFIIGPSETEVTVKMERSLTIKGTVTDAVNDQPIANFGISAVQSNINPYDRPVIYTNGKYELSIDESSSQTWKLYVSAIGYDTLISDEFNIEAGSLEMNFKLVRSNDYDESTAGTPLFQEVMEPAPERVITGIVKDENGQPVENAIVSIKPYIAPDKITDSEGKFTFKTTSNSGSVMSGSPLSEEISYLFARYKDRNLAASVELEDNKNDYEITLLPGTIFSGKVVDINGIGIPNADMSLTTWISDSGYRSSEPTKIEPDGSFEIKAITDGFSYLVNASANGYGERYVRANTSDAIDGIVELEPLVLDVANLSISGIVVDQFDQPISNARVYAYGNGQPSRRETYTNSKGEFKLDKMCPGQINIQIRKESPEVLLGRITVNGGDKDLKIVLSSIDSQGRLVPRQSASLVNKSFPNFENIEIDFSPEQAKGKRVLICFWDLEQRPSRNLVSELSKRTDELKEKNVEVLLIHSSEITGDELKNWLDEYKIPFTSGRIVNDFELTLFKWNVRAQPWLVLTDENAKVLSEGFSLNELNDWLADNKNISLPPAPEDSEISDTIVLKLIDPEGYPVSGARVGTNVETRDKKVLNSNLSWSLRNHEDIMSDQWGEIKLSRQKLFPESWSEDRKVGLYILHEERKIGAVCEILTIEDERNVIELKMVPVCYVHGKLDSKGLNSVDRPLYWTNVYMGWNRDTFGILSHMSDVQKFEFLAPPGKYELDAYGSGRKEGALEGISAHTKNNIFTIEVKSGESELDLGTIDLEPEKLSAMVGKRAPEIGPIKEWKNGSPVKLADLIGKIVVLYFDGDSPNTSRDFPRLVELYDRFHDDGLEIISIYNCESMEQLEKNWIDVLERFGGESEVPFRIAIDGGESGFYEGTDKVRLGQTYNTYDIRKIPTVILIDTKGNIVGEMGLYQAKEIVPQMLGVSVESELEEWRKNFNKVYSLEDGQILKHIAPPFIPERKEYYQSEESSQHSLINNPPDYFTFHWDGKLNKWGYGFVGLKWTLKNVLNVNIRLNKNKYEGPEDLLGIEFPGDWIVRKDATMEQKLKALEEILENEIGRKIRFEKRYVEKEAVVATGTFKYSRLPIAKDDRWILMFTGDFVDEEGGGGGTADSVHEFLDAIGDRVNVPIIDETEPPNDVKIPYRHYHSAYLSSVEEPDEKSKMLVELLENITLQTNLHFVIETRPVEKWFVVESE